MDALERVGVLDRCVRTEHELRPGGSQTVPAVGNQVTTIQEVVHGKVRGAVHGLHGRGDTQLTEPRYITALDVLGVLDPLT